MTLRAFGWWRAFTNVDSILDFGTSGQPSIELRKMKLLCNGCAVAGSAIVTAWLIGHVASGRQDRPFIELGLLFAFVSCLLLNSLGWLVLGRTALFLLADGTVFVESLRFEQASGGSLLLLAMVGLPVLLFAPSERLVLPLAAMLNVTLFVLAHSGMASRWLGIVPRSAPGWYFAANATSAVVTSFLIPYFLRFSNHRTEAEFERVGQERLRNLIDANIIGVARGVIGEPIQDANDACLALLGYSRSELLEGKLRLERLTPPEYVEKSRRALVILKEKGKSPVYEKEYFRRDGVRVPVLVGMAMLDAARREVVGFMLDISAQKNMERQRHMLRASQEAVRLRELFNSIASHELKTPLSALTLQVQLALRSLRSTASDPAAALRRVEACEVSAKKLARLIDALLDVTKCSQGDLVLAPSRMDLVLAAHNVVSSLEAGGLSVPNQIQVDAPRAVCGAWDPTRIDQMLTNLCSNAVKYGAGKPVRVRIRPAANGHRAHLEVIDHGMGIEPAMIGKIFDPFQRAASTKHIEGLGLGLFVVRSIVGSHGGTIGVETMPGRGTRFVVGLPCAPPPMATDA